MNKEENQSVGFSCYDTIYLKFDYIGEEEFDDLIEYIESEHISCEGATDIVYDLKKENQQLQKRIEKAIGYISKNSVLFAELHKQGNYFINCNADNLLEILKGEENVKEDKTTI